MPKDERTLLLKKTSRLTDSISLWEELNSLHDDLQAALELYQEEESAELLTEITNFCNKLDVSLDSQEIDGLFDTDLDDRNAIVSIHPGAGGTESADWTSMLFEMYRKWISDENLKFKLLISPEMKLV